MKKFARALAPYFGLASFVLAYYAWWTGLTLRNIRVVNYESGDSIAIVAIAKQIITGQWPLFSVMQTRFLGAPFGQYTGDYPLFDWLHYLIFYFYGFFTQEPGLVINLFWITSFVLIALSAFFSLSRLLRVDPWLSAICALVYAFLPYHWMRFPHIFLSNYFLVPILASICLRIAMADGPLSLGPRFRKLAYVSSFLAAINGVYYAYFFCVFLTVVSIGAIIKKNRLGRFAWSLILATVLSGVLFCSPYIVFKLKNGKNPYVSERLSIESDIYGLKMANILLPGVSHAVPFWGQLRAKYHATPNVEGKTEYITLFGILGILIAFISLLDFENRRSALKNVKTPGVLIFFAIFFAMPSGAASLIANYISPQFRSPNRISVYIAFFALFTLATVLQHLLLTRPRKMRAFVFGAFFIVGLVDVSMPHLRTFHAPASYWSSHESFFQRLDRIVPKDAMIFQIPYMEYPETANVNKMGDYSPMIPFLHSRNLRWSYGVTKHRPEDQSMRFIWSYFSRDINGFVQIARAYGYEGILMDRFGFADDGKEVEAKLSPLALGPVSSRQKSTNNRFVYFSISGPSVSLPSDKNLTSLPAVDMAFTRGFYNRDTLPSEGEIPVREWFGAPNTGKLEIYNRSGQDQEVTFDFTVDSAFGGELALTSLQALNLPPPISIPPDWRPIPLKFNFKVPAGYSSIDFNFTGNLYKKRHDWRRIGFRLVRPVPQAVPQPPNPQPEKKTVPQSPKPTPANRVPKRSGQ